MRPKCTEISLTAHSSMWTLSSATNRRRIGKVDKYKYFKYSTTGNCFASVDFAYCDSGTPRATYKPIS